MRQNAGNAYTHEQKRNQYQPVTAGCCRLPPRQANVGCSGRWADAAAVCRLTGSISIGAEAHLPGRFPEQEKDHRQRDEQYRRSETQVGHTPAVVLDHVLGESRDQRGADTEAGQGNPQGNAAAASEPGDDYPGIALRQSAGAHNWDEQKHGVKVPDIAAEEKHGSNGKGHQDGRRDQHPANPQPVDDESQGR